MTFAMIKPNAVKSGLIGRIIDRYIAAGLSVCAVKMHQMTSADARVSTPNTWKSRSSRNSKPT